MARVSWKFYPFRDQEIEAYIEHITDTYSTFNDNNNKRHLTVHKLNFHMPFKIYTGKWTIQRELTKFHFGYKLGQLTKTRKPFYFRSKKKNVKKN